MKAPTLIDRLKLEFGFWLGTRAAVNYADERETFDRLKACASVYDLARLYLATADTYRALPAREAWRRFRHDANACILWRSELPYLAPSWVETLRHAIQMEGGEQ